MIILLLLTEHSSHSQIYALLCIIITTVCNPFRENQPPGTLYDSVPASLIDRSGNMYAVWVKMVVSN